jgi:hypothetical protein
MLCGTHFCLSLFALFGVCVLLLIPTTAAVDLSYIANNEQTCSDQFHLQGNLACMYAHVKSFGHLISTDLVPNLEELDNNPRVRRIYMDIHTNASDTHLITPALDLQLDNFLMPRPWWRVLSESRTVHKTSNTHMVHIMLLRYSQQWEMHLRFVAAVQYPPQDQCGSFPLLIGRMGGSGWGSQVNLWEGQIAEPYRIFNIWDSVENRPDEAAIYASKNFCPDIVNKRLCAFLPLTNCTMPTFLTEMKGPETSAKCWTSTFVHYSNATAQGVKFPSRPPNPPRNPVIDQLEHKFEPLVRQPTPFETAVFYDALGRKLPNTRRNGGSIHNPPVIPTLRTQAFLFRPNARFRRMVMEQVHNYRTDENFPLGTQCASIHIRRGDRLPPDRFHVTNLTEWCSQYRRFTNNGSCINIVDPTDRTDVVDWGCFSVHPYGTLKLTDYLEKAEVLLGNSSTNVFVMTDDAKWLKQEQALLANTRFKDWKVHALAAKYDKHSRGFDPNVANEHETENGVEFLASLTLARQCQSFVGHFGSGFTGTIYHALCFQHDHSTGKCPAAYDIGYAYDPSSGNQLWLPPLNIRPNNRRRS